MIKYITPWFLPKEEFKYWDLYSDKFINHFFSDGDKYEKVVWFQPSEYNRIIEDNTTLEKIKNICNLEIWLGNFNDNNPSCVINWPTWTWLYSYDNFTKYEKIYNPPVDKLYTCLNRKSKYWRGMLVDELAKNNLIDDGYLSWHDKAVSDNHLPYKQYPFKYFDNKKRTLDNIYSSDLPYGNEGFIIQGNYYEKGFVHILPEAIVDDYMFMGNKFAQALLHCRPFLGLATKNSHMKLKELGFELYDELFNYEFDNKDKIEERAKGITENLINLKGENYNSLLCDIKNKLEYNKYHFMNLIKGIDNIPKEFWDIDYSSISNMNYFKNIVDKCTRI
jgi:hypothetical protein